MNINNFLWFVAGFGTCLVLEAALICWACAAVAKEDERYDGC